MIKKTLIIAGVLVILFIALIASNILSYRSQDIKTQSKDNYTFYEDKKFGYSFEYPSNWIKTNGSPMDQGYVDITTPDKLTQVQFWYKDSKKLNSINDLKKFAEDDAKFSVEQQNFEITSLDTTSLNGDDVAVLKGITLQGKDKFYHTQYYIADLNPTQDQNIFVWNINIVSKNIEDPSNKKGIDKILQSVKFDK